LIEPWEGAIRVQTRWENRDRTIGRKCAHRRYVGRDDAGFDRDRIVPAPLPQLERTIV
jgi:hypothetical protein